jgi:hypothetical protein
VPPHGAASQVVAYTQKLIAQQGPSPAPAFITTDTAASSPSRQREGGEGGGRESSRSSKRGGGQLEEKRVRNALAASVIAEALQAGASLPSGFACMAGGTATSEGTGGGRDGEGVEERNDSKGLLAYPTFREGMAAIAAGSIDPFDEGDLGQGGLV